MPLEQYAEAKTLEALQRAYLDRIIDPPEARGSDAYYGKIQEICAQGIDQSDLACVADASFIALFDLCRASFVKRIQQNGAVKDICDTRGSSERTATSSISTCGLPRLASGCGGACQRATPAESLLWVAWLSMDSCAYFSVAADRFTLAAEAPLSSPRTSWNRQTGSGSAITLTSGCGRRA